jgi:cell shape-determining protein MreD
LKAGLALVLLGLLALMAHSVVALAVPARFLPDMGMLFVVAVALCVRSTVLGVLFAVLLGYTTDLLSGTLLGQHVLLRLGAYGAARVLSARLNLRGPLPLAFFVLILSLIHAGALWALEIFFLPGEVAAPDVLRDLAFQAVANALLAPPLTALVAAIVRRLENDDSGRLLRLDSRELSL